MTEEERYTDALSAKLSQVARYLRASQDRQKLSGALRQASDHLRALADCRLPADFLRLEVTSLCTDLAALQLSQVQDSADIAAFQSQLLDYTQSVLEDAKRFVDSEEAQLTAEVLSLKAELTHKERAVQVAKKRKAQLCAAKELLKQQIRNAHAA